jgi:DNA-directed RNA polymerase specialized sigma24 family protein
MGELIMLIHEIQDTNKEAFNIVMHKMEPLINKYTYLLYKDEKEDTRSELNVALWEAVNKISLLENDGQVINYLSTAVKNRYLELYRVSKKHHDNEMALENDNYLYELSFLQYEYENFEVVQDISRFLAQVDGLKREIFSLILINNYSDIEISRTLKLSRQYVNRMRKQLQNLLQEFYEE